MSKIDELIKKLCPNGVEYISLINLAEVGTGSHNTNEELNEGKYPFLLDLKFGGDRIHMILMKILL